MSVKRTSIFRGARARMSLRLLFAQIGLAALVVLLAVVWLRIPEASVLELTLSALLGLGVLALAGAGQSCLMLRLRGRPATWSRLLRGTLAVLAAIALWLAWRALLDRWHGDDYEVAGYLNSRLPHWLRHSFTYERLALWLGWAWTGLGWLGAGVLGIFAFALVTSSHPLRAILRTLASISWWAALLVFTALATALTGLLIEWTPGHGLGIEMLSLVLRLGTVVLVDAAVACFLLAMLAECVILSDARYETPDGTPAESQPRTAEEP